MKILIKYSVMIRVDNIGAIFMASNITTTCHIKYVNIWYKYINEYAEDGVVKIIFFILLKMTVTFSPKI